MLVAERSELGMGGQSLWGPPGIVGPGMLLICRRWEATGRWLSRRVTGCCISGSLRAGIQAGTLLLLSWPRGWGLGLWRVRC